MAQSFHLKWYEWIGWLVNVMIMVMAGLFVTVSFIGDEVRAALTALAVATVVIAAWTWVLIYYGKPREAGGNPQTEH
jgi:hypothetical protein